MVEARDASPKPSLGSTGRAFLTLEAQLVPMLSPREDPQLPAALTTHCRDSKHTAITFLLPGGQCWMLLSPRSACKAKAPVAQTRLGAWIFRRQR